MRAVGNDIFGLRSLLSPLDGERAENRWWTSLPVVGATDATELAEAFRKPVKETESRVAFRIAETPEATLDEGGTDTCRETRDPEGDTRTEFRWFPAPAGLEAVFSPSLRTPNSFIGASLEAVEGSDVGTNNGPALRLVLRDVNKDEEFLRFGDATAEDRLAIRGILVGVSFTPPESEPDSVVLLFREDSGGSLVSRN